MNATQPHARLVQLQRHQLAAAQGGGDDELRLIDHPLAAHGRRHQRLAVVGEQVAADGDAQLGVLAEGPVLAPRQRRKAVAQAVVLTEVSDTARYAPLVQIARRGAHQQRAICQTPGLQGTVLESADAHGHVPATIEQVDLAVGQAQLHLYRRMAAAEFGDQRGDELRAEGQGHVHP